MSKRDKTREVFIELVNLQLAPHDKTYEDVVGDPEWYMKYNTTREDEKQFMKAGVDLIKTKLKMTKKLAEQEMSWFILQWGLTTNETKLDLKKDASTILKSDLGD
tara:strand:- start:210 stop:524 length:315 start_codon:yes stop_codon:yes gene_type:complete